MSSDQITVEKRAKPLQVLTQEEMLAFARTVEPRVPLGIDIELQEGKSPLCKWDEEGKARMRQEWALKNYRRDVYDGMKERNMTMAEAHDYADSRAHLCTSGLGEKY